MKGMKASTAVVWVMVVVNVLIFLYFAGAAGSLRLQREALEFDFQQSCKAILAERFDLSAYDPELEMSGHRFDGPGWIRGEFKGPETNGQFRCEMQATKPGGGRERLTAGSLEILP